MSIIDEITTVPRGTAPFNEVNAQQAADHGEQDDHSRDPEGVANREAAQLLASKLPDGFIIQHNQQGKPFAAPALFKIKEVADFAQQVYNAREEREQQLPKNVALRKALTTTYNQLSNNNEFLGNGFLYNMSRQYLQEFCNACSWIQIHVAMINRHSQSGNEDGVENSTLNLESSNTQAFAACQVLDWCVDFAKDRGIQFSIDKDGFHRGAKQALQLQGWNITNRATGANRKASHQNAMEMLFGGQAPSPEQVAIDEEEEAASS